MKHESGAEIVDGLQPLGWHHQLLPYGIESRADVFGSRRWQTDHGLTHTRITVLLQNI
jgi:hypothetical protein